MTKQFFTFGQLKYLLAVAEAENFTAAGRLIGVSQPAISGQLRLLERSLGVTLFRREKRRILLTPTGWALHQFALDIGAQFDDLLRRIGAEYRPTRASPKGLIGETGSERRTKGQGKDLLVAGVLFDHPRVVGEREKGQSGDD